MGGWITRGGDEVTEKGSGLACCLVPAAAQFQSARAEPSLPENSPALQCWGPRSQGESPARDERTLLPSLTGLGHQGGGRPSAEALGYFSFPPGQNSGFATLGSGRFSSSAGGGKWAGSDKGQPYAGVAGLHSRKTEKTESPDFRPLLHVGMAKLATFARSYLCEWLEVPTFAHSCL